MKIKELFNKFFGSHPTKKQLRLDDGELIVPLQSLDYFLGADKALTKDKSILITIHISDDEPLITTIEKQIDEALIGKAKIKTEEDILTTGELKELRAFHQKLDQGD